jgi:hypothetical protein
VGVWVGGGDGPRTVGQAGIWMMEQHEWQGGGEEGGKGVDQAGWVKEKGTGVEQEREGREWGRASRVSAKVYGSMAAGEATAGVATG